MLACKKTCLSLMIATALSSTTVFADAVWVQQIQGGEMRFYDWGYSGPQGQNAGQFDYNGFDTAAQIQHVVTVAPDRLTPDDPALIRTDLDTLPLFREANMDAQTNFYQWGYTSPAGSTFNNMQIDADGDYFIARNDMSFNYYGQFDYQYEGTDDPNTLIYNATEGVHETNIGFQPYALSDATGWCGSVTASNPGALEAMAGQVTFDFGFEAYMPSTPRGENGEEVPGTGSMQIVQNFVMRSYGSLEIDVSVENGAPANLSFQADAVVNNTSPLDSTVSTDINGDPILIEVPVYNMDGSVALDVNGAPRTMMVPKKEVGGGGVDADFYNQVSFMGGGIVPQGVWVKVEDPAGPMSNDNILEVLDANDGEANTLWHANSFAGYPFLLRADGIRIVDALDFSLYSDLTGIPASSFDAAGKLINLEGNVVQDLSAVSAVPVPAAVWLFGSGLLGLMAVARRKRA